MRRAAAREARALGSLRRVATLRGGAFRHIPRITTRRQAALALAPVILLVVLFVGLLAGRRYTQQKINVEGTLRAQIIPALEKQLGQKIEVGEIESDYLSRVVLRDVVIGRNAASPLGALIQAKSATIHLDIIGLAMRRSDPLLSISRVVLQDPQVDLRRDARGRLNLAQLLRKRTTTGGARWSGVIDVSNGRVYFQDGVLRSARGRLLRADARGINGRVRFNGANPLSYGGSVTQTLVGGYLQTPLRSVTLAGTAAPDGAWLALQASLPRAPATMLTEYAFRRGEIVAQGGYASGVLNLMWERALPRAAQYSVSGRAVLSNVSGWAKAFKEPGTTTPLRVANVSGGLRFADKAFETTGISLVALNTPLRASGRFTFLPRPTFDLTLNSNAASATRALQLIRTTAAKTAAAKQLQSLQLQAGSLRGMVRVIGDLQNWTARGTASLPAIAVAQNQLGQWRGQNVASHFALQSTNRRIAAKVLLNASNVRGSQALAGAWQTNGQLRAQVQWTNAGGASPLQVQFSVPAASGSQRALGAWRGNGVSGFVRWNGRPGSPLALQANIEKLAGRHPSLGTLGARSLRATLTSQNNGFVLNARAQNALGSNAQFGRFAAGPTEIGTRGVLRGNAPHSGTLSIRSSNAIARSARLGAARVGSVRAHVRWNGRGATARWNARHAAIQSSTSGSWSSVELVGIGQTQAVRGRTSVAVDVEARRFAGRHARYGFVNGRAARAVASTSSLSGGAWRGTTAFADVDLSRANLRALSPSLAQQVRGVGTATGKFRFAGLASKNPTIKGRARLSEATLVQNQQTVQLRQIETAISLGGERVRLTGLRAQSTYGPLQAEAQSDLRRGGLRFSILAPDVGLTEAQLNQYLRPAGLRIEGRPRVRLRVSASGDNIGGAGGAAPVVDARFDVALPQGRVHYLDTTRRESTLRTQGGRLAGAGRLRFVNASTWRFNGDVLLAATHLVGPIPGQADEARAANLQVVARGSVDRTAAGVTPRLVGSVRAGTLLAPLPGQNKPFALTEARADFILTPDRWQAPRFFARAGGDSSVAGHATLLRTASTNQSTLNGQLLLEKFDATRARDLLQVMQTGTGGRETIPRLNGVLFARADFSAALHGSQVQNSEVGLQARLYNGLMIWANAAGDVSALPLDSARIATSLSFPRRSDEPWTLDEVLLWSGGGRLWARGSLTPQGNQYALDLDARINTLRLPALLRVPELRTALQNLSDGGGFDGLLSGDLKISGTTAAPSVTGKAALRLAQVSGFQVAEARGDLEARTVPPAEGELSGGDYFVALRNMNGNLNEVAADDSESTPATADFTGEFVADSAANAWHLNLDTQPLRAPQLMLVAAQANARTQGWRDLPIGGALRSGLRLAGTLRDESGAARFATSTGQVEISSGASGEDRLRWRGRDLGVLDANLQLQNGALQVRRFALRREVPGAGTETQTKNETETEDRDTPLLSVAGVLPVSLDSPDLDARVTVQNQQLSFVLEVLRETHSALKARGQNVAYLNNVLQRLESLPSDVEGRVDLEAQLEQSWRVPIVAVRNLDVQDIYIRNVQGIRRRLPNLRAAFVYDGNDNGAIAIRSAELRLPRVAPQSTSETAAEEEDAGDNDLLIRILRPGRVVPGGDLSLQAEILNADLEQLADWVPSLRGTDGRPVLRGRLSDFVVQLAGTVSDPEITGSLLGENWQFRQYSLDRVRLNRFTIAGGELRIEPGFLTVVKGEFQSETAWGTLPWTWGDETQAPGPAYNRPMEVHLPIARENFGALAGIFLPAIQNVGADDFSGEVTITGTLNEPTLAGSATITNGTFRVRSAMAEFDAGVAGLTGTLRFVEGNRLEIGKGGLRGRLIAAREVRAPSTGNEPSAQRRERDDNDDDDDDDDSAPQLGGNFVLLGGVTLDLDPAHLAQARRAYAWHRYDLRLALADASYYSEEFSGIRDFDAAVILRTGEGDPRSSQQLRWLLSASGQDGKGRLSSHANLRLTPDFAESIESFFYARAQNFAGGEDFATLLTDANTALPAVTGASTFEPLRRLMQEAGDQQGRITLSDFRLNWRNVARGTLDGRLLVDNGLGNRPQIEIPFTEPARSPARSMLQPAALTPSDASALRDIQAEAGGDEDEYLDRPGTRLPTRGGNAAGGTRGSRLPLRFTGEITLEEAELFGAPTSRDRDQARIFEVADTAGTAAAAGGGFSLPDAPVFNIRLRAGRDVQFVSSNLRATITGELEAGGTPRDPILSGTLFTRGGNITFPNARARLVSGELSVAARRDPRTGAMRLRIEIDTTATGRSGRYTITLRMRGPLDTGEESTQDLRIDVTSNPALSSDEAFAQLLGTANFNRGDLDGEGNEQYARAVVGLLSGPLFSGIERSLERALGLTSIALDYRVDEPIGIEIGKAIGDRLYISYRRALQRTAGQKTAFDLRIDYRIKGDIELGLETNERDERRLTIQKRWRF